MNKSYIKRCFQIWLLLCDDRRLEVMVRPSFDITCLCPRRVALVKQAVALACVKTCHDFSKLIPSARKRTNTGIQRQDMALTLLSKCKWSPKVIERTAWTKLFIWGEEQQVPAWRLMLHLCTVTLNPTPSVQGKAKQTELGPANKCNDVTETTTKPSGHNARRTLTLQALQV